MSAFSLSVVWPMDFEIHISLRDPILPCNILCTSSDLSIESFSGSVSLNDSRFKA